MPAPGNTCLAKARDRQLGKHFIANETVERRRSEQGLCARRGSRRGRVETFSHGGMGEHGIANLLVAQAAEDRHLQCRDDLSRVVAEQCRADDQVGVGDDDGLPDAPSRAASGLEERRRGGSWRPRCVDAGSRPRSRSGPRAPAPVSTRRRPAFLPGDPRRGEGGHARCSSGSGPTRPAVRTPDQRRTSAARSRWSMGAVFSYGPHWSRGSSHMSWNS